MDLPGEFFLRRNMKLQKLPYLNVQWLSRIEKLDLDLRNLMAEVDALCRARPLGRNLMWCSELLCGGIAINEARERLEAMWLADGWKKLETPELESETWGQWLN
jgi:hypothetical protein